MLQSYFITGTDTGVGKSWVTATLMHYFKAQGKTVIAMKPIASGCEWVDGQLKNEDALLMHQFTSTPMAYQDINPYAFELPVSPHIAANRAGEKIEFKPILEKFSELRNRCDVLLVEGVGGWYVPLNEHQNISDLAVALDIPVIMVVAIRLGCINHACLTDMAINASGVNCVGWVGSCTDPDMLCTEENINTLIKLLEKPLLGILPYSEQADFNHFAKQINFSKNND